MKERKGRPAPQKKNKQEVEKEKEERGLVERKRNERTTLSDVQLVERERIK